MKIQNLKQSKRICDRRSSQDSSTVLKTYFQGKNIFLIVPTNLTMKFISILAVSSVKKSIEKEPGEVYISISERLNKVRSSDLTMNNFLIFTETVSQADLFTILQKTAELIA